MSVQTTERVVTLPEGGLIVIAGRAGSLGPYRVDEARLAERIERFVYRRV
ncbi:hypothetical protein [Terrihabitans rhizophilus]|jgi:hypothetical protein|uniref:Uncharacterized protein n=1 Tax=Terrihabitans rhizophilus TaxID=3092662 RepID=A0ABU4RRB0_9HYPH|nr:hypothetical protein [Terrihabitans sp. PJ23]MDX6805306.1 hypothetical protein [Terrihabitans sp. PJ23]